MMGPVKLKLDLHDIYNRGGRDRPRAAGDHGRGRGQEGQAGRDHPGQGQRALKKHVLRFLDRKDIKALYHRVEKDSDNLGRIFVHFRWK